MKMSSMGDVIHTLPAVTDASRLNPSVRFDWVVERAFADIPALHPAVDSVLPIDLRQWRKAPLQNRRAFASFRQRLRETEYDLIIDAQGLIKSAFVTWQARGSRAGFDWRSAREGAASLAVNRKLAVAGDQHAIARLRQLFAAAIGYALPTERVDYGLRSAPPAEAGQDILLLHGTTWKTKHWPESFWIELATRVSEDGYQPIIPAGNEVERRRAELMVNAAGGEVLDRMPLRTLADRVGRCLGAVSVDTGLGHLAAALDVPTVSLFGPTDPGLTGPIGRDSITLQDMHLPCMPCRKRHCRFDEGAGPWPPCFAPLTPVRVWETLKGRLS